MSKIKKRVLIVVSGFIPSTIIGVMRPLRELEKRGEIQLRLRLSHTNFRLAADLDWCEVGVFSRNCEQRDLDILYALKRAGKKIIYDIDDNFEEIPLSSAVGVYHRAFARLHVVKRFFQLSDVSRVYSLRMADRAQLHGGTPQLIRCYFDSKLIQGLRPRRTEGRIKIAYPTGRLDDPHLESMFYAAVRTVLERNAGTVEFHIWRKNKRPKQLIGVPGVVVNQPVMGYERFIREFY